jgi:type IV secretory pathway VirB3-like protein
MTGKVWIHFDIVFLIVFLLGRCKNKIHWHVASWRPHHAQGVAVERSAAPAGRHGLH